ncbi:MAG: aldo/keto reductase [Myxococcota bacterium]
MNTSFELNDGHRIPAIGLGTWKSKDDGAYRAVREAIAVGYRHIDGAWIYGNEDQVGRAIGDAVRAGDVTREELFVTTKLWNSFHAPDDVERAMGESLKSLALDYVDLYLMHWPIAFRPGVMIPDEDSQFWPLSDMPLEVTYEAMLRLKERGLTKSVGVSNFSVNKLEVLAAAVEQFPAVNQVELHPYHPQEKLLAYCAKTKVHLTAYSPLGSRDRPPRLLQQGEPTLLESSSLQDVAKRAELTPAQLLIAWAIDRGTSVIPKSENPDRIRQNFVHLPHALDEQTRAAVDAIATRFRFVNPQGMFRDGVTHEGSDFWA